jgi:chromosome segregation ATPase
MSLQRIGIYAGAILLAGLGVWFFGGVAVDAMIASRLKEHQAKLEAVVQEKDAEIKAIQGELSGMVVARARALADVQSLSKEAARLSKERLAWMNQADALAKKAQSTQEEVARVPDALVGQEIRAALADIRAGVPASCPF